MAKDKKATTPKPAKINLWVYHVYIPVLTFIARIRYGLKIDKSKIKDKKGPFLVLGNHTTPIDFLFFSGCIYPKPLNYVVASNMYYATFYRIYLNRFNTIPKKQFSTDFNCIKLIKRFLDNDISVLLFPEGRVTVDGTTGYINPSIGRLVKWLGYPVVCGLTKGGYVSNPKWGRHKRSGKISLGLEQILSRDDIAGMSAAEISDMILGKLRYNDNQTLIDNGYRVAGYRIAEGLERVLYKCPKCGAEFKNRTKWKKMTCLACGNTVIYQNSGTIVPAGETDVGFRLINEWYKYERDCIAQEVEKEDFSISDKVIFLMNNAKLKKFTPVGEGAVSVSREGIVYRGGMNGEEKTLTFKIQNHASLAFKMGDNFEVSEEENIYRFQFKEGLYSTKYVLAIEEIYKRYYWNEKSAD